MTYSERAERLPCASNGEMTMRNIFAVLLATLACSVWASDEIPAVCKPIVDTLNDTCLSGINEISDLAKARITESNQIIKTADEVIEDCRFQIGYLETEFERVSDKVIVFNDLFATIKDFSLVSVRS